MRKAIETNNGLKGGFLKGKAHYDSNGNPLGGIKAVVTDQGGKAVELESSEVIINKKTVQSDKVLTVKGTPKEILSTLNQMDGNGVAIGDEEAEILAKYRSGGKIGEPQNKEIERLKNLPYSKFLLEVLDSYKELNAEVGVKGYNQNSGEPIIGYFPNQYEYMYKSDSTGKPIRFFIDLGNEKYIHPFDINPKFNPTEQKRIEQKADYFVREGNENYEKSIKELKENNELDIVIETLKKALKTFNIENQYDSSDIFKSSGNSILESKDENKRRMKFDVYYFRVNDSELKSNIKNLDLERFKDEYLAKYRTGGSIPKEIIMYHGSKSKFEKFNMINNTLRGIELGSHFGTYEQAKSFMSERYGENDKFYIYKCKLNLENTLKVDDIGWWTADNIYRFILKNKRYKLDFNDIDISTPENILKILKEKNIDSFKYSNLHEGEGYSYLVFDSSKIEILDTEIFRNGGELIKRADGSYSRRGLWDNIRDNVGSGRKPTKQMLEQEAKIKSKYHLGGDMSKHLAPNGKPSNLNHEQWHLVRTPEFKAWFGDWEKGVFTDYQKLVEYKHKIGTGASNIVSIDYICEEIDLDKAKTIKSFHKKAFEFLYSEYESANKNNYQIDFKNFITKFLIMYKPVFDLVNQLTSNEDIEITKKTLKEFHEKNFQEWVDYKNKDISKVVDENGEPLVVYHGTKSWDIYEFDLSKSKRISSGLKEFGTYFTDNKKLAESYRDWSDLKKEEITDIDKEIYKWEEILYKTRNNRDYDYAEQQIKALKELKKGKIYGVFLNLKKMYSFDAKKETNIEAWNNLEVKASYKLARNRDAMDFLKEGKFGVEKVDGIQAKNIVDAFVQTEELKKELLSNVYLVFDSKNIKLADGTNTTFDENNDDIRFAEGGSISKMTPSELKEFYASPEGKKLDAQTYAEWKRLVNMTKSELEKFYNSVEGKKAGLSSSEANRQGIDSGRESARWIMKMKDIPYKKWSSDMWRWAKKQINFIKRMSGMKGSLYNDKGEKTRKHTALLIWGHNPEEKFKGGGGVDNEKIKLLEDIGVDRSLLKEDEKSEKVFLGNMRASNGDNLELYAEEINLSYGSYKKFVRKITASNEKGNVVFSFWNKPDEIVILHLESSSSPYYHKLLKDKPSENILKEKLGYGTDLVNKLIDESKSLGKEKIIADDVRSLNAEKYWERLGFVIEDDNVGERVLYLDNKKFDGGGDIKGYDNFKNPILINGFISNKEIDGKEIFLITYNSGGQEGLDVHQTMNPLAMLDAVEKKTGLHTNTLQVFIYEHTENSNRIETEDELEFLKDNYTVIIVDRDSVEFYNGHNPKKKFAEGGGIGDEVELELYQVRFDTDDDSEIKLVTTNYEDAKSEYEGATIGDFGDSEFNVSLEKKIDKYKFVYELDEDESIDDYPIEEYYDDSYYYELIEEGEFDNIENRVVTAFNSSSEDLLDEVQEWAKDKFGNYKYNTIDVYSEDDIKEENDPIGSIQLRIADHSQNESNLPYGIDRSLSVVIANKDATRGRFQQNRPQIYFDGSDSFDYVISEIENYIEDAKEYIQSKKFEKGGRLRKFRGGGELSQKALAVETNDLTDFVRKYFIKDGRIDVSDAMQELFGNKRGKSIADEYRKRIGLHKKGGLTISQLAHKLWEQHRDEVRDDIDDSDFRNAVEEVLISEYGVSSMIKSLMEKSGESEQDRENEYWMNQFDEGDDEYYEDLSDEEVADYFRDMEGFERELAKGTEHEMEHLDTLKKVAEGKLTPEEAVVETAKTHIEENPEYYEDLQKMELEALKDKLKKQGYNVTIPSGGNRISVMGYGKGYFNAKKQKADSILSSLKRNGYNAVSKLDADGYYDFWVYADEPKQDLAKMEAENEESIPDLIEGLKVLADSLEGAEKKEIEDVIEGLEILLESDNKFEIGGEFRMATGGKIVFKPITTPL